MKVRFRVGKPQNLFFFVDNLSAWSGNERTEYNRAWLAEGEPLSKSETKALNDYSLLARGLKRRGLFKEFRESFFIRKTHHENYSDEQHTTFKILSVLSPRFNKLWKRYRPILKNNRIILQNAWHELAHIEELLKIYVALYRPRPNQRKFSHHIDCFLLMIPLERYQGGKSISETIIAVEVEGLSPRRRERILSVLQLVLHELVHSCFETAEFKQLVAAAMRREPNATLPVLTSEIAREALMGAILRNQRTIRFFENISESQWQKKLRSRISAWDSGAQDSMTRSAKLNALKNFVALSLHRKTAELMDKGHSITEGYIQDVIKACAQFFSPSTHHQK